MTSFQRKEKLRMRGVRSDFLSKKLERLRLRVARDKGGREVRNVF